MLVLDLSGRNRNVIWYTDKSDVHAKGQGQRSDVKVTKVKTHFSRFRTVAPVWIHIWRWNDAPSLMWHRTEALLFSRSSVKFQGHTAQKNRRFWLIFCVSGFWHIWLLTVYSWKHNCSSTSTCKTKKPFITHIGVSCTEDHRISCTSGNAPIACQLLWKFYRRSTWSAILMGVKLYVCCSSPCPWKI